MTAEGKTPKTLVEEMVPLLDSRDVQYVLPMHHHRVVRTDECATYSNSKKVRIISLYIQYRDGVPDEDRRRLYQHAHLSRPDQDAINALVHLGLRISRVSVPSVLPVARSIWSNPSLGTHRQGYQEENQAETQQ